MSETGLLYM